jgi:hypothetical protein
MDPGAIPASGGDYPGFIAMSRESSMENRRFGHSSLGQVLGRERMLFNLESTIEKHADSTRRFNPPKL